MTRKRGEDEKETADTATIGSSSGNPTEPMTQGLLGLSPPLFYCYMDKNMSNSDTEITENTEAEDQPKAEPTSRFLMRTENKVKAVQEAAKHDELPTKKRGLSRRTIWTIKITIVTFALSCFFSFLTEISTSQANVVVATFVLLLLIIISIVFDGIGVAATSCELAPLLSMAAKKVPGARVAVILVKNAEKVSNICADVIGDICGIISGACTVAIVMKINFVDAGYWVNILLSAVVAAITVGGKAFNKDMAIKNSKDVIMLASRFLGVFYHPKDQIEKKKPKKHDKGAVDED